MAGMDPKKLNTLTEECLEYIAQVQQPDGSFLSLSSPLNGDVPKREYESPFFTGLIAHALGALPASFATAGTIQRQACKFLLSQQSGCYSFNYWQRQSDMAREFPYPDDLDDTFSILAALTKVTPELHSGTALACIARLLIATETQAGGPYRTWLSQQLVTAPGELLPDIAVNANIAHFLKLQGLTVAPLLAYLHAQIEGGVCMSQYYPSVWPVLYFLARSVPHASYALLTNKILKESYELNKKPDLLFCALRLSALISVDAGVEQVRQAYDSLIAQIDKGWSASPFCFDPVMSGHRYVASSEALVKSLVLEALWLFEIAQRKVFPMQSAMSVAWVPSNLHMVVHEAALNRIQTLPREISHIAAGMHSSLRRKDADNQIALLPTWFSREKLEVGSSSFDTAVHIGVASVFGWIAYTIYDTIMDTAKDSHLLPIANTLLLELTYIYCDLLKSAPAGLTLFKSLMSRMEAGNMWELAHARTQVVNGFCIVPVRGISFSATQPAEKSLGHALGPLIFSFIQSEQPNTFDGADILSFFEHYLTARQLNDDAHDWFEDISHGHLTMVNDTIVRASSKEGRVDLVRQKLAMQRYFWNAVLPDVAGLIIYHIDQARVLLHGLCLPQSLLIEVNLLNPLDKSARTALADSTNAALFLKAYA